MRPWLRNHSTELKLFFTVWLVYAVFVTPAGGVNPNRYIDLVHAIVNEGRFAIDTYHENTIDKAYYNGHYYAAALPGPAFLAAPAYFVFKGIYRLIPQSVKDMAGGIQSYKAEKKKDTSFYGQVDNVEFFLSQMFLNLTVVAPVSALGSIFLYLSLRLLGCDNKVIFRTVIFYSFGTSVFFYSTTFFLQIFSATLVIGSFYFVLKTIQSSELNTHCNPALVAGLLAGCGLLVDYSTIFASIWLGVWLLVVKRLRPAVYFVLGFIPPVLILMSYLYVLFDSPISIPHQYIVEEQRHNHIEGFLGSSYPRIENVLALTFGEERGLFLFVPITLAGVLGLGYEIWKKKPRAQIALVCALIVVTYVLFNASLIDWRGGAAFGPRYLIPALPFLFVGVAFAYQILPGFLVDIMGLLSVFINWLGAQFGFAATISQHFDNLLTTGPALPALRAILSHSTSQEEIIYKLASSLQVPLTLGATLGLVIVFLLLWKDVLSPRSGRHHDGI